MKNRNRQKTILKICIAITILLILWCGFSAVNFIIKGAYDSAFFELVLILANSAWVSFYLSELRNIYLLELNDVNNELIEKMETHNKLRETMYRIQQRVLAGSHNEKQEILESVEELSDTYMVLGLQDEHYVSFINKKNVALKEILKKAGYYDDKEEK